MAGNVEEWCGLPPDSPLLRPGGWDSEPRTSTGYLAGGSFDDNPILARCAHRSQLIIGERTDGSGFRLVRQVE